MSPADDLTAAAGHLDALLADGTPSWLGTTRGMELLARAILATKERT